MTEVPELSEAEIRKRLAEDPDFVAIRRVGYSLSQLEEKYPDHCPPSIVASALRIPERLVGELYDKLIAQVRTEAET
jgi:hypothetical protein